MHRILWLATALAFSQSTPWEQMLDSQKNVQQYLIRCARRITDNAARELSSKDTWEAVRAKRLEEMRDMLGLLPWPARTPLNIKVTRVLDKGSYTIENIAFESMPKVYVTGNLYLPKQRQGRVPAIVYVCGHSYSPQGDKVQYQRHGISLARNGYAAFILDSIQIAETFALHHGVHSQNLYDWYARGYTPAGVEVWNAMRAIDYLVTRPEVDAARIGMTGRSGGAAMSWFTAAVDPRVKVVAPVMGISTYAANVEDNTQKGHCDCMFAINSELHDMMHQGALIAPRPLLMMHGKKDTLFPVKGYEEFERTVGNLYNSYGARESFGNIVVDTGHEDSDFLREKAIRWFDKHLMHVENRKLDMDYSNAPPEQLAVFADNPPKDALNYRVHETFTAHAPSSTYKSAADWERRRAELLPAIRKILRDTGEPFPIRLEVQKPKEITGKLPAVVYVASDGEDAAYIAQTLAPVQRRGAAVRATVWPRGVGEAPWPKTTWTHMLRNAMHTGQTVDSMRLQDVLAAVRQVREMPDVDPARITVMGRGISAALALYAAIVDPAIAQVLLQDPPSSHTEGPLFLNILRYTDLPEAAALLAPRRLNFYGHIPAAYEYTKNVYSLLGKTDHVFLTLDIGATVFGRYDHNFASGQ
ncbi:MAG: acetylxylan esterase [Bryobacteraceae bacterium]|nr:acetylxylan esterase [Bryobacteraceae bacterium]